MATVLFIFNVLLCVLALAASRRAWPLPGVRGVWFFTTMVAGELPWLMGVVQLFGSLGLFLISREANAWAGSAFALCFVSLLLWLRLHRIAFAAQHPLAQALAALSMSEVAHGQPVSGAKLYHAEVAKLLRQRAWCKPLHFRRPGVVRLADVRYGDHPRQTLDIYHPETRAEAPWPVLLHIHGGGWVLGHKHQQGQPLLWHMASRGWLCVDINYRLSPAYKFPCCLVDVKQAIAWTKQTIHQYGGNGDFVALTGGSAGGHLCALAALSADQAEFQPGFERADTSVQAAVPMYGVYDFTNQRNNWTGKTLVQLLRWWVMPANTAHDSALWQQASPIFRVHANAPPMLAMHGTHDALVAIEDARDFAALMAKRSNAWFLFAELPGAQHGFDLFHGVRAECAIVAIELFLRACYQRHCSASKNATPHDTAA